MASDTFGGKVVWITGASSGIGRSLALAFNRAGARLILSARSHERLELVKRDCRPDAEVHVLPFDLADTEHLPAHTANALGSSATSTTWCTTPGWRCVTA
jgi:short-subunit dehydrogenase